MTDLWTRETVEREVRKATDVVGQYVNAFSPEVVAAALLAGAECEACQGKGSGMFDGATAQLAGVDGWKCAHCDGTGYNQSSLARALAALRGAGT